MRWERGSFAPAGAPALRTQSRYPVQMRGDGRDLTCGIICTRWNALWATRQHSINLQSDLRNGRRQQPATCWRSSTVAKILYFWSAWPWRLAPSFSSIPATFCAVTASEGMKRIEGTKPRQCRRLAVARTFETSTMSRDKASARVARQLTGQRYILNYKGEVSL